MAKPNPLTHRPHRGLLRVVKSSIAGFLSRGAVFAYGLFCASTAFAEENMATTDQASAQTQAPPTRDKTPSQAANMHNARATKLHQQAKDAGDQLAANRYADAAKRWTRAAAALEKAAQAAKEAASLERETTRLQEQTRNARTLVEQTEARRARALGELRRLGVEAISTSETSKK